MSKPPASADPPANFDEVYLRLIHFTKQKTREYTWGGLHYYCQPDGDGDELMLAKASAPMDIAHNAIRRVLQKGESLDPKQNPDVLLRLTRAVESIVSKMSRSPDNWLKGEANLTSFDSSEAEAFLPREEVDNSEGSDPRRVAVLSEDERLAEEIYWKLLEIVGNDSLEAKILESILFHGIEKRADLAKRLNVPAKQIDAAKKRLQNRRPEIQHITRHVQR